MERTTKTGNLVGVCFMILWCTIAFGMAFTILGAPVPIFFAIVPFGMGLFGVVFCVALARGRTTQPSTFRGTQFGSVTYSGDSTYEEYRPPARERRAIYQVPSRCPSCGASISTEEVDWVGPLQAKCPYCMATIDVEERLF